MESLMDLAMMGVASGSPIPLVSTLPDDASLYAGRVLLAPRWPLLGSAPATVVNGLRFRLAEAPMEFGREYLGVSGAWVPQDSVTMGVWQSNGGVWSPATDTENPDEACVIPIKAGGNGSEVATLILTSEVNCTVFIDGTARFYTNSGGTIGESSTANLTANVQKNLYIRLASGTSTIYVEKCNRISSFGGFTATANSPTLNGFNTYYTRNSKGILFSGNLISISGTTYPWVNVTGSILFNSSLILLNHPTSLTTGTKYNRWLLRPAIGYMPSADVDRLLIDLAATWISPSGTTPQVDLRGNCGARTSASNAAVSTLTGRGITVLTN